MDCIRNRFFHYDGRQLRILVLLRLLDKVRMTWAYVVVKLSSCTTDNFIGRPSSDIDELESTLCFKCSTTTTLRRHVDHDIFQMTLRLVRRPRTA